MVGGICVVDAFLPRHLNWYCCVDASFSCYMVCMRYRCKSMVYLCYCVLNKCTSGLSTLSHNHLLLMCSVSRVLFHSCYMFIFLTLLAVLSTAGEHKVYRKDRDVAILSFIVPVRKMTT